MTVPYIETLKSFQLYLELIFSLHTTQLHSTPPIIYNSEDAVIIIIIITLFVQRKQRNKNSEWDSRAGQHGSKNKSYTDSCP